MKKIFATGFCLFTLFCGYLEASPVVVVNEFFADPPSGLSGDANRDGVRNASDDEFVELLNLGDETDLKGWSLWDSSALRHEFQSVLLGPWERLVVFGGGNLSRFSGVAFAASSGSLNLNNIGDGVILKNSLGIPMDSVFFGSEGNRDQSLTRFPEGNGSFQLHASVSSKDLLFSPGRDTEGNLAPEPNSPVLILMGVFALASRLRRRLTSE